MQQDILEKNPSGNLRVYAVWFDMLAGDSRERWDGAWLTDPRVVHLWDERKVVGTSYANNLKRGPGPEWDVYFLYGPAARWDSERGPLTSWGGTVEGKLDQLQTELAPLLRSSARLPAGTSSKLLSLSTIKP